MEFCTVGYVDTILVTHREAIDQCDRDIAKYQDDEKFVQEIQKWKAGYMVVVEELLVMRERLTRRITTGHPATKAG